ncbi:MAG: hypothetical protein ACOCUH_04110, partial [Bacteriovoracia bacterium]
MSEIMSEKAREDIKTSRIFNFLTCDISSIPIKRVFIALLVLVIFLYVAGFAINSGPSMNHLGLVYLTDWGSLPQEGQVFRFTPAENPSWYKYLPQKTQIKRCVGLTDDGRYVYEGDNQEWSEDNRDNFEPVPASHISGVITLALHHQSIFRENSIELNIPKSGLEFDCGIQIRRGRDCFFVVKDNQYTRYNKRI